MNPGDTGTDARRKNSVKSALRHPHSGMEYGEQGDKRGNQEMLRGH